jgi:hypothetical protein
MVEEQANLENRLDTEGVPGVYANHASSSVSFSDIRLYFSEVGPKALLLKPAGLKEIRLEAAVHPKVCVILNPEFARAVRNALSEAIKRYEGKFGTLRIDPSETVAPSEETK